MDNFQEYSLFYMNDPYDEFNKGDKSKDKKFGRKAARRTQRRNLRDYLDEEYNWYDWELMYNTDEIHFEDQDWDIFYDLDDMEIYDKWVK